MNPPVVLTIAGSDSGAGAGLQADLKTFAALGVFGTCAVTAVTAQNTTEVRAVQRLDPDIVRMQIDAVLADLPVAAVKTGMLASAEIAALVAALAAGGRLPRLVVDPVLVSSTGTRLVDEQAERLYLERLLPLAAVFTPNLDEAGALLGRTLRTFADQLDAARELAGRTAGAVVVTGGHPTSDRGDRAVDVVVHGGTELVLARPRVGGANNHGSGCSFASAIAAGLAKGAAAEDAITAAGDFVHRALQGAARWTLGSGHGPLDHFHWEAT